MKNTKMFCMKIVIVISLFSTFAGTTDTVKMGPYLEHEYDHEAQASDSRSELPDATKIISKRSTNQLVAVEQFKERCSREPFSLFPRYHYAYQPTNDAVVNEMFSQARAYLSAFKMFMNRRDRDYVGYDDLFKIDFPAIFPIACFETAYLMQSSFPDYGRYDLLTAQYNREHEFLRKNNTYTNMRRVLRDLVDKFRFMNKSETTTLERLCNEMSLVRPEIALGRTWGDTNIYKPALSLAYSDLTEGYDVEKFTGVIKILLEDMLVSEIIRQSCIALTDHSPIGQLQANERDELRRSLDLTLKNMGLRYVTYYHKKQIEEDVKAAPLSTRFSELIRQSSHEPVYNQEISDMLTQKYYEFAFRVTFYAGGDEDNSWRTCYYPSRDLRCLMKNDKIVLVSWKPRYSLQSTYTRIMDRDDYPPVPELPSRHMFHSVYAESMLAHVYAASGYIRNLHKRNLYPALIAYVTGDRSRRVTPSEIPEIWRTFTHVLDTVASVKIKLTRVCMYIKQVPHREQRDEAFEHLERIFFEMNTRYENIDEALKPIMAHYRSKYTTASDQLQELTDGIRQQFHTHYENTRLYLKEDISNDGRKKLLGLLEQACANVVEDMQKLTNGLSNGKTFMETLSNESPMHAFAYLLVRLHDLADLMVYGIQCTLQGHRYAIDPVFARTPDDIYMQMRKVDDLELNMSRNIGDAMEHITKYAAKAKYYWQAKVRQELDKENRMSIQVTNDSAQRIANRLEETFPWNKFSVSIHKEGARTNNLPTLDEQLYGEMFFTNPDYSMVYRSDRKVIIVNWDLSSEPEPQLGEWLGFGSPHRVCVYRFREIHVPSPSYTHLISVFVWRAKLGLNLVENYNPRLLEDKTCCGSSTSFRVYTAMTKCWYPFTPVCPTCPGKDGMSMLNDYAGLYIIANYGTGY